MCTCDIWLFADIDKPSAFSIETLKSLDSSFDFFVHEWYYIINVDYPAIYKHKLIH